MTNINNLKHDLRYQSAYPLKNAEVIIVDGLNLFHRQYHFFNKYPAGTAYGFVNTLLSFKTMLSSNKFVVCWDGQKNWRKESDEQYKQVREQSRKDLYTDEEIANFSKSLSICKEMLQKIGIIQILKDDCEADDIIAYIALQEGSNVIIASNDKDFAQLVTDKKNVKVVKPAVKYGKGKGFNYNLIGEKEVLKQYGVKAADIPKLLAIAGDVSDNVKGVKNFGPVKALKLINEGKINKSNITTVFNKEQLKQFISSYKLVKLGNDKFHDIKIKAQDIKLTKYEDNSLYLDELQNFLNSCEIKRYTAVELKRIYNLEFIKYFEQRYVK